MEVGPLIGEGRTAVIRAFGDHEIIKLFRPFVPEPWIMHELRVGQLVEGAGLPTPRIRPEVRMVDGQPGLIYERVEGPTMLQRAVRRLWTLPTLAQQFAALHVRIHNCEVPALPSQRDALFHAIEQASPLSPTTRGRVSARLAALPVGQRVCHGDFHPDNVLLSARGPVVIDWVTATHGNPLADVARTTLLFLGSSTPPGLRAMQRILLQFIRRFFYRLYLRAYRHQRPAPQPEIEDWLPIVAAARLSEQVKEEEARLVARVERAFG